MNKFLADRKLCQTNSEITNKLCWSNCLKNNLFFAISIPDMLFFTLKKTLVMNKLH